MPLTRPARVSVAGHFGEWMQGRIGPEGEIALITLPCPALQVHASRRPAAQLQLHSAQRLLVPARLRAFLQSLNRQPLSLPAPRHAFTLRATMPPGGGAGASTAALVAIARLVRPDLDPAEIALACIATEGASDPLMWPRPDRMLWASRKGHSLARLPAPPRCEILGGFLPPTQRTDPRDLNFADISDLIAPWRQAAEARDLPEIARLASLSAKRNLAQRGPRPDPLPQLARELGALGHLAAHTGSARGLIFAPGCVPARAASALRAAGFRQILQFRAGGPV
ncbi:biphenyl 2,3-dioxygenase [Thioclava dalianensis]|uniref:Biphenyl 2,3-dioxygenase n=1 Tax=Thioclava dalianensis TaxID=1185766 RepID=A0A074T8L6_9RHOB|nr:hypothetical protein [Thioclava dalianensis]KEP68151.1 biphenyl 2,3-dioxygenase [Thioclava dalianensis]SFN39663.1 Protein involved in propanediol utilization [Thioclava dalianensis]